MVFNLTCRSRNIFYMNISDGALLRNYFICHIIDLRRPIRIMGFGFWNKRVQLAGCLMVPGVVLPTLVHKPCGIGFSCTSKFTRWLSAQFAGARLRCRCIYLDKSLAQPLSPIVGSTCTVLPMLTQRLTQSLGQRVEAPLANYYSVT